MSGGYLGELRLFAGVCPQGWLPCEGQRLASALYQVLAQRMAGPTGQVGATFSLPDLRGRVALGAGPGFERLALGGVEAHALTIAQMPSHRHPVRHTTTVATASSPAAGLALGDLSGTGVQLFATPGVDVDKAVEPMAAIAVGETGAGAPHPNLQPYLGLRWCICVVAGEVGAMLGEVRAFAVRAPGEGDAITRQDGALPSGWVPCDGRVIERDSDRSFENLIGTAFAPDPANPVVTLPDLRSRVPLGDGWGPLGSLARGARGGQVAVSLTREQLPAHRHDVVAGKAGPSEASPVDHLFGPGSARRFCAATPVVAYGQPTGATGGLDNSADISLPAVEAHSNLQPYAVVVYAICTCDGEFPLLEHLSESTPEPRVASDKGSL